MSWFENLMGDILGVKSEKQSNTEKQKHCSSCNFVMSIEDKFCGNCGIAVNKIKKQTVDAQFDQPKYNQTKKLSLNWFNAYKMIIYIVGPLSLINAIILLINADYILIALLSLVDIILIPLLIYGFYKRRIIGWYVNFIFLISKFFLPFFYTNLVLGQRFLAALIIGFVWVAPNVVYFYKRRCLFE